MGLYIISFVAGVLTVLAPCILPLLPIVLGGAVADVANRRRPLIIIGSLSASVFIFTFLLKASTALISVPESFWGYLSGVILAAFGLTLLFPTLWDRVSGVFSKSAAASQRLMARGSQTGGVWGDVLIGSALGPIFTTCSPTFFVILATILPQSTLQGVVHILIYILGLALALFLIAIVGQKLVGKLDWAANPRGWFKRGLGILFIAVAVFVATGADKSVQTSILDAGYFDVTKIEEAITRFFTEPRKDMQKPEAIMPYIEIENPAGFVNSEPFRFADFVGKKVILLDFVTYSCINCQRTFPYLNAWHDTYADDGLLIVGIHTPEFAFERDIDNVRAAAKEFGLEFPLVLDNDYATWNAYGNRYWPRKYLIDIHGNIVYDHIGEGAYDETEAMIRTLLKERADVLGEVSALEEDMTRVDGYAIETRSPETYFGSSRNERFGNGSPFTAGSATFTIPERITPNLFYLKGEWQVAEEYIKAQSADSALTFVFDAKNVYIVADTEMGGDLTILIDGKPITADDAGADVVDGKVHIDGARLYHLFEGSRAGIHRLDIQTDENVQFFAFTFG